MLAVANRPIGDGAKTTTAAPSRSLSGVARLSVFIWDDFGKTCHLTPKNSRANHNMSWQDGRATPLLAYALRFIWGFARNCTLLPQKTLATAIKRVEVRGQSSFESFLTKIAASIYSNFFAFFSWVGTKKATNSSNSWRHGKKEHPFRTSRLQS